jgi:hypothetical protein
MKAKFIFFSESPHFKRAKPYELFLEGLPPGTPTTNCEFQEREVQVEDLRHVQPPGDLDSAGFQVLPHESTVLETPGDLDDHGKLVGYLDMTVELVKNTTKAWKVICYDWRVSPST